MKIRNCLFVFSALLVAGCQTTTHQGLLPEVEPVFDYRAHNYYAEGRVKVNFNNNNFSGNSTIKINENSAEIAIFALLSQPLVVIYVDSNNMLIDDKIHRIKRLVSLDAPPQKDYKLFKLDNLRQIVFNKISPELAVETANSNSDERNFLAAQADGTITLTNFHLVQTNNTPYSISLLGKNLALHFLHTKVFYPEDVEIKNPIKN